MNSENSIKIIQWNFHSITIKKPLEISRMIAHKKVVDKYFYKRPSSMDLLYEELNNFIGNLYDRNSIVEWNIYGFSDYQLRLVMHRILIYASTISAKHTHLWPMMLLLPSL